MKEKIRKLEEVAYRADYDSVVEFIQDKIGKYTLDEISFCIHGYNDNPELIKDIEEIE